MKTGDLVTLSAYGRNLAYCKRMLNARKWAHQDDGVEKPLVGLLTKIAAPPENRPWLTQDSYHIVWIGEGTRAPKGREGYDKYFYRKDLKLVSRA